jgi:hypothetical protein
MKLENYKKDSYEFSKQVSDLVRQFSFVGIAIIWIFKSNVPSDHLIPKELITPLIYLVICLVLDLLQYLISTFIWLIFFRYNEIKNHGKTDIDIKASGWLSIPSLFFFITKIVFLYLGYFKILSFLINKL